MTLNQDLITRVARQNLESCVKELRVVSELVDSRQAHDWFRVYEDMLYDKTAFRAVGLPNAYYGSDDVTCTLAYARIKLLAFYAWHEEKGRRS
jgi:hypothetical protein